MKYDSYLVNQWHWGGGETKVYDIENFRVFVCISTGSSLVVYEKSNAPEALQAPTLIGYLSDQLPNRIVTSGWYWTESLETAIDINLNEAKAGGLTIIDVNVGDKVEFEWAGRGKTEIGKIESKGVWGLMIKCDKAICYAPFHSVKKIL